jgi:malonyl-CoA/methylmalonyl-CoA synthetase
MSDSSIPLIARAGKFEEKIAVIGTEGSFSYTQLQNDAKTVASRLLNGTADLQETRVAFITPPSYSYVVVQWGIWLAGGIAVPLAVSHPKPELEYVIEDSGAAIVVAHPDYEEPLRDMATSRGLRFFLTPELCAGPSGLLPEVRSDRRAMIVYTSGTTNKPKGVVSTHAIIQAQVTSLVEAWGWSPEDHILEVLPLHHIHGIVNVLTCSLWSGATCEILPEFDVNTVWDCIENEDLTIFMAVPTIYARLVSAWNSATRERQRKLTRACATLRLMVSGSAALPLQTLEEWRRISGHTLLERYGMTEIGMALSNPLLGTRKPGYVGTPLPNVNLRLMSDEGVLAEPGTAGEIQVSGPLVFLEYWGKPEETRKEFTGDWFRTGDVAVLEVGAYRILGRSSVDIIKTGGFKVSALEIEEVLREHPSIAECAVVGLEDLEWGERVCTVLVFSGKTDLTLESLRTWAKERLAPYKVPTRMLVLDQLPRNAMGKIVKPDLTALFQSKEGVQ